MIRLDSRLRVALLHVLLLLIPVLLGCAPSDGTSVEVSPADVCELTVAETAAVPRERTTVDLRPIDRIDGGDGDPLGGVAGVAWHAPSRRLYVLDGVNGEVRIFDERGVPKARFGRHGPGPGEFEELPREYYGSGIAVTRDRVFVSDLYEIHAFDIEGRFIGALRPSDDSAETREPNLGALPGSAVYSRSGWLRFRSDDLDFRSRLELLALSTEGDRLESRLIVTVRNHLGRLDRLESMMPRDPYTRLYRRIWDARPPGLIVTVAIREHGVCFFDPDGKLVSAHRVDAPVIEIDQKEKARVLDEAREKYGPTAPFLGIPWDEFYESWPETGPRYLDVVLSPDSVAWVERPVPGWNRAIDLYHARRGYLATIQPLGERLPIAFVGPCALTVETEPPEDAGEDGFHGLVRRCPPGREAFP